MDIEALGDEVLMRRVCTRDVDAFRVLYGRYELRVFNFVFRCVGERALAEDLLQETFWRIWQAAHTFDPARGGFPAVALPRGAECHPERNGAETPLPRNPGG